MPSSRLPTALALAVGFGCLTAGLVNLAEHPAARFGAYLVNAGWAWAALSVLAGALVAKPLPGAVAGWLAAGCALFAFDATDAALHHASLVSALRADLPWWLVGLAFCPLLGLVGSQLRRPGRRGLLARLVVPAGAALEMVVRPPGGGLHPEAPAAQVTVWIVAALTAAVVLAGHRRTVRT